MDSAKLNDWAQVVGIFALVASLVFVGLQLKQSQDIALAQASQTSAGTIVEMMVSVVENPLFISSAAKIQSGAGDTLTVEESIAMRRYAGALLFIYQDQYLQYTKGFVTEKRWQASRVNIESFLSGGDFALLPIREVYELEPARYSSSFHAVMDAAIKAADDKSGSD